jgi:hypothetical protein
VKGISNLNVHAFIALGPFLPLIEEKK